MIWLQLIGPQHIATGAAIVAPALILALLLYCLCQTAAHEGES